jgi:hypothetical protein
MPYGFTFMALNLLECFLLLCHLLNQDPTFDCGDLFFIYHGDEAILMLFASDGSDDGAM